MSDDKTKHTVTIVVEGTEHEWPKGDISYAEVVTLEVNRAGFAGGSNS